MLIGLLILVTLMKALSDAAYAGSNLRMTKHMIGLLEIMLVLAMAATVRQAGAQTRAAYYTLVGSALVGIALTCAPLPEGLIHMGVATLATVRVLTEALVLVYVAELAAYNHRLFAKAALLYFILPEMVTCVVGYGMLPELFQDMSAGAGVVLQRVGILAMACLGIGFLSAYGLHDVKAMGLNAKNAQTSLEAPSESADSSCSQEIALSLAKRFSLTDREATMIGYLYQGHSAKSISSKECISVNTVQTHSRNLYRKLGIHSRHELVRLVDSFERPPQKSDLGPF